MKRRIPTGVAYNQAHDCFSVPVPDSPGVLALARGEAVRERLKGQLPRNGVHLRDVIVTLAYAWRAAR